MKKITIISAVAIFSAALFTGCEKYDDSRINERMDGLEERVAKLEETAKALTKQTADIQTLVNALNDKNYIVSGPTALEDGGYEIVFSKTGPMVIKDGKTPSISAVQDLNDGEWYWTIDGNRITVDGKDVPASRTPTFEVRDGALWVSFEGGLAFPVEGAGAGIGKIADVIDGEESVTFILSGSDSQPIVIPKVQTFRLNIDTDEVGIYAGGYVNVPFSITAGDSGTKVVPVYSDGYTASVSYNQTSGIGSISIKAPETLPKNGYVIVMAVNGKGVQSSKILTFEEGVLTLKKSTFIVGAQGGEIKIDIQTNLRFERADLGWDPNNWIHLVEGEGTKAVRKDRIVISVDEYKAQDGGEAPTAPRQTTFSIIYDGADPQVVTITQLHTILEGGGTADLATTVPDVEDNFAVKKKGHTEAGWLWDNFHIVKNNMWPHSELSFAISGTKHANYGAGVLTSPLLKHGCGVITLGYGSTASPMTPQKNFIHFKVEVKDASGVVRFTKEIGSAVAGEFVFEQKKLYTEELEVNIEGDFTIVVTNFQPGNNKYTTMPNAVVIDFLEWTGYSRDL